jgi:predicted phage terminase large subunit-like protein
MTQQGNISKLPAGSLSPLSLNMEKAWRLSPELFALKLSRGNWRSSPHLRLLSRWLVEAAARKRKRIIVTMPPRHGKSETCSAWFPAWYLELFPDHRIMLGSYEASFAASWGRRVRNIIQENSDTLKVRIAEDLSAAAGWETTLRGGMMTAGVDGSFTGKGANVLLIDDPTKNAEKANSPTEREKIWNFYRSTAYTRMEPDGVIILIMTRWHEDDLAGRLINMDRQAELLEGDFEPERFDVLNLPALAEDIDELGRTPGKALWPDRFDEERLKQIRHVQGSYFWNALYQQHPIPPEGGGLMFRSEWFPILDEEPGEGWRWLRWWDRAATDPDPLKKNDPDWTIGLKLGIGPNRELCVGDVVRMRGTPGAVKAKMLETAESDGPDVFICGAQDPAAAGVSEVYSLKQMFKGFRCEFYPESGDKVVRAGPVSAECEPKVGEKYGNVSVVNADWNAAFFEILRVFPTKGKHDDDVDALSGAHSVILKKFPPPAFRSGGGVGTRSSGRG